MWNKTKSLMLSITLVYALMFLLAALLFCIPAISKWYETISSSVGFIKGEIFIPICIMLYICDFFGICAVLALRTLLNNISKDKVFIEQNTKCLRIISWCCIFVGITFCIFGLWRLSFFFGAFFAFFLGLVMRVLKNVFEKAVEIKTENDFTI